MVGTICVLASGSVIYDKRLAVRPNDRIYTSRRKYREYIKGRATHENLLRSEATLPRDPSSLLSSTS